MTTVNDMPTCLLSPTSVNISGTAEQVSTLTIITRAASSAQNQLRKLFLPAAGGTVFALLVLFAFPNRRNWLGMLGLLVVLVSLGSLGCGGHSHGGNDQGTTPGTYTVMVTGTSGTMGATVGTVALTVK